MEFNITSPSVRPCTPSRVNVCNDSWYNSVKSQREWSVRLCREFDWCINYCHGDVFFFTLTFMPSKLPYLCFNGEFFLDDFGHKVKCFDNERVSEQLIRSLRQNYDYRFKYIVFPEFGSDDFYTDDCGRLRKAQNMPHYHGLLFFEYHVDADVLKQRIFTLWDSCLDCAFDFVHIKQNYGFSTYVSKYVSKGFENKMFSRSFLKRVSYSRDLLKQYKDIDLSLLDDFTLLHLNVCSKFLSYYETHRPKVLCSNGIGASLGYTHKEYFDGCISVFYDGKYHEWSVPQYNIRKYCNNVGYHYIRKPWFMKDGKICQTPGVIVDGVFTRFVKRPHWSLHEKGVEIKRNHLIQAFKHVSEQVSLVLSKSGDFSFDECDYIKKHGYDYLKRFHDWNDLVSYYKDTLLHSFGTFDISSPLFYYRKVWFTYSKAHLYRFFGTDFLTSYAVDRDDKDLLRKELNEICEYGEAVLDAVYEQDLNFDTYFHDRFLPNLDFHDESIISLQILKEFNELVCCIFNMDSYCNFLKRQREFDLIRKCKRAIIH